MLELAIEHPETGPKIRTCRILRPDERQAVEIVSKLRKLLMQADALDGELRARLESALDDSEELKKLTENYLPEEERIRLGYWGEGGGFRTLDEGSLLKDFIVQRYRPDLKGFRIAVLFQEKIAPVNRRGRLGTQMKLPGKMRFLSQYDAVTTLGFGDWTRLTDTDRQRLVHHELEHLEVIDGGLSIRAHDFEDFVSIFSVYGPSSESGHFGADSLAGAFEVTSSQMELMGPAAAHG